MSMETVETIIVALAVIGFVTYRQTRWQPVDASRLFRMPAILAVAGLFTIGGTIRALPQGWHPGAADVAVLIGELGAGLVAGVLMGRLASLRTENGVVQTRLAGSGLAVWLGFIALRVGFGVLAVIVGATFAAQPGATLLVVALIKLVQSLIVRERVSRHRAAESRRAYAVSGF
jgi:hypothetical protein